VEEEQAMTHELVRRLLKLEGRLGADDGCPECGAGSGGPVKMVIIERAEDHTGPDSCPTCGRVLFIALRFSDVDLAWTEPTGMHEIAGVNYDEI
jgi:hypothetical protein